MNNQKLFVHGEEGTHSCCDKRLKKEGGKARCCFCVPHEDCDSMPTTKQEKWDNLLSSQKSEIEDKIRNSWIKITQEAIEQTKSELKEKLRGRVEKMKRLRIPTHGICCTCQVCGYPNDDVCECPRNLILDQVLKIISEL